MTPQLVTVPRSGAGLSALTQYSFPESLTDLLAWRNGLDLEVVRLHGVGPVVPGILPIRLHDDGTIEFASDPAGFCYVLNSDGTVSSIDTDGGSAKKVADGAESFFQEFIFGSRAAEFAGPAWAAEVKSALGPT
ncbi:MAG: hypothetical protein QM775_14230 [Pirellulales bacterium]